MFDQVGPEMVINPQGWSFQDASFRLMGKMRLDDKFFPHAPRGCNGSPALAQMGTHVCRYFVMVKGSPKHHLALVGHPRFFPAAVDRSLLEPFTYQTQACSNLLKKSTWIAT